MLDKMIGVSPPQKGEAPDSKLANSKDFRGSAKSDYKRDFEKALEKKLDQKKESLVSNKEVTRKTEELRAAKKDKKSLGGTKKKVTENDDKTVSNLMASKESKVEIPDSKIEDLAEIEVDISKNSKTDLQTEVKAAGSNTQLSSELLSQVPSPSKNLLSQSGLIKSPIEMPQAIAAESAVAMQLNKQLMAESSSKMTEDSLAGAIANSSQPQQADLLKPQSVASQQPQLQNMQNLAQSKALDLEAELGAEVGFTADLSAQNTSKDLLQKMKAFDVDKNSALKPQSFEQNVLSRLQNEQIKDNPLAGQNFSGESQGDLGQQSSDRLKDLKSDVLDTNQLHQAAGQTHTEFKDRLGLATAGSDHSLAGKLEESREANMSEIMNQAQYLVKKGGGEVSIRMSPEGMGEVHLKVLLQDGKLNIEMQTQNKDVKKLIEDSLTELKSGLAAHRLSLEHIKIDSVNATNADNNTQSQSNLNQGSSQEQGRERWNDFQGNMNNQSDKKASYADSLSSGKVSPRSSSANAASAVSAIRTYGGTKGATVNRVA